MLMTKCLQRNLKFNSGVTVDADKLVVLQTDDITLKLCDHICDIHKLARTIRKLYGYGKYTSSLDQTMLYHGGHRNDIHVAAA